MTHRWLGALALLVATAAQAQFPGGIYDFVLQRRCITGTLNPWGTCTIDANCGTGGVCLEAYVPSDFDSLAIEVEQVEIFLGVNGGNIILRSAHNTAAEVRALMDAGQFSGTGPLLFGTGPTIDRLIPVAYTMAQLPAAGTSTGSVYYVTNSGGACTGATGTMRVICVDIGTGYAIVGGTAGAASDEPYCQSIDPLRATTDHKMLAAWPILRSVRNFGCRCRGVCTTPAQIALEDSALAPIGAASTCAANANMVFLDVSTDVDGDLSIGEPVMFFVNNNPVPDGADEYLICVTFE